MIIYLEFSSHETLKSFRLNFNNLINSNRNILIPKGESVVVGLFHILVYFFSYWPKCKIISQKKNSIPEMEIFVFQFSFTIWPISKQTVDVQKNAEPI